MQEQVLRKREDAAVAQLLASGFLLPDVQASPASPGKPRLALPIPTPLPLPHYLSLPLALARKCFLTVTAA